MQSAEHAPHTESREFCPVHPARRYCPETHGVQGSHVLSMLASRLQVGSSLQPGAHELTWQANEELEELEDDEELEDWDEELDEECDDDDDEEHGGHTSSPMAAKNVEMLTGKSEAS